MSQLSVWLQKQGEAGQVLNAAGEAVIPVLTEAAETQLEAGLTSFINAEAAKLAVPPSATPTLDAFFGGLVNDLEGKLAAA